LGGLVGKSQETQEPQPTTIMTEPDLLRISDSFYSKRWVWQIDSGEPVAATVIAELERRLPHIATDAWPLRFALGGVYLAGKKAVPSMPLSAPCRLEYYEPKFPLERLHEFYPEFNPTWIHHVDEDLAVIYKPAGLPTTAARDQQVYNLQTYLERYFKKKVHLPSRLDTGVSGLILCSLSERMNRYLQRAYDKRQIEKLYRALVQGAPPWRSKTVELEIARDPRHPILRRCVQNGEGEKACTKLILLKTIGEYSVLQAQPITGRTHQIRLHCASEGLAIVGDPYYGGAIDGVLNLISLSLSFHHPYLGKPFYVELPEPLRPWWDNPKS
jgi:23S rRNA-/tRNA-specific pseudouridylate synthase